MTQFDKDLQSPHKDLFLEARNSLLSFAGIQEVKKTRITTYLNKNGGVCHMRTMPYGIDFGFLKGVKMEDKYGLLTGKGKTLRVLSLSEMNQELITYYVDQAIEINTGK